MTVPLSNAYASSNLGRGLPVTRQEDWPLSSAHLEIKLHRKTLTVLRACTESAQAS